MPVSLVGLGLACSLYTSKPTITTTAIIKGTEIEYSQVKKEEYISRNFEEDEQWITIIATAYSKDGQECGKKFGDGITASGRKASSSRGTIAAPYDIPLFSQLYIPELNKVYVSEDRGNRKYIRWINGKMRIDIYMDSKKEAKEFGVKEFKAKFIK